MRPFWLSIAQWETGLAAGTALPKRCANFGSEEMEIIAAQQQAGEKHGDSDSSAEGGAEGGAG